MGNFLLCQNSPEAYLVFAVVVVVVVDDDGGDSDGDGDDNDIRNKIFDEKETFESSLTLFLNS
jgi:hypothetical protein